MSRGLNGVIRQIRDEMLFYRRETTTLERNGP